MLDERRDSCTLAYKCHGPWQYGGYAYQEGTSDAQARVQLSVVYNDSATDVAFFTPVVSSNWTLVYMRRRHIATVIAFAS